ncbi:MAG: hypothetical protein ACKESB_02845 [Candidatus Hodgkinia cicadicola]
MGGVCVCFLKFWSRILGSPVGHKLRRRFRSVVAHLAAACDIPSLFSRFTGW